MNVRPKKHLGQHFLVNLSIAEKITSLLPENSSHVLEIGPGKGVLSEFLLKNHKEITFVEIDLESIKYLKSQLKIPESQIIEGDFLKLDLSNYQNLNIIGNFPYYISSQILFRVFENHTRVFRVVCMLQKEVAKRIASPPNSKEYGILSVLLQAFFDIKYEFSVKASDFYPPPKVESGVISLQRNTRLSFDTKLFLQIVKLAFNQRRKTVRNALKSLQLPENELFNKRAENLSVDDFLYLTHLMS